MRRGRRSASHYPCGGEVGLLPSSLHRTTNPSTVLSVNSIGALDGAAESSHRFSNHSARARPRKHCKSPVSFLFLGLSKLEQEKYRQIISLCWGRRQLVAVVLKKLTKLPKYNGWKLREYREGLLRTLIYIELARKRNHRITESQNSRGWKGPLWVI